MLYTSNADLPPAVRRSLPRHAQDMYREAFNHAFANVGDPRQEEASRQIAWVAVKRVYSTIGNEWVASDGWTTGVVNYGKSFLG